MDPKAVLDVSQVTFDSFRRDYLVASVVVLLVVNGAWALAVRGLVRALGAAQEARVQDKKDDRREISIHMDRSTEAMTLMLSEVQQRAKRRRSTDPPVLGMEPVTQAKRLPEGQ